MGKVPTFVKANGPQLLVLVKFLNSLKEVSFWPKHSYLCCFELWCGKNNSISISSHAIIGLKVRKSTIGVHELCLKIHLRLVNSGVVIKH